MKPPHIILNILLLILSSIGAILGFVLGYIWAIIRLIFTHKWRLKNLIKELNYLIWLSNIANDQKINVDAQYLLNDWYVKPGSPKRFGHPNDTISHVLGWVKYHGKIYPFGMRTSNILDRIDDNHVENARTNKQ